MSKEIKKYVTSYIVFLKGKNEEPIEIGSESGLKLMQDLNNLTFVIINGEAYNKFEILKIKKRKSDYEIWRLLDGLPDGIRKQVRKEMKLYKKDLTTGVVQNMIEKYYK